MVLDLSVIKRRVSQNFSSPNISVTEATLSFTDAISVCKVCARVYVCECILHIGQNFSSPNISVPRQHCPSLTLYQFVKCVCVSA